jgi:hypothetical protein
MAQAGIFLLCVVLCLMVVVFKSSFGEKDIRVTWLNSGSVCVNDDAMLRCNYDQNVLNTKGQAPDWIINGETVNFASSDHSTVGLDGLRLRVTTNQSISVSCSVLTYDDNNQISDDPTSESVMIIPKDLRKPEQPTFEDIPDRKDAIMLRINHNNICFTSHTFIPDIADNCSITERYTFEFNKMMEIPFNGMHQGSACEFNVTAVCKDNDSIRSEPKRHTVFLRSDIRSGSGSLQRSSHCVTCIVSSLFAVFIISDFRLLLSFYM